MVNEWLTNAYSCRPILTWIPLLPQLHTVGGSDRRRSSWSTIHRTGEPAPASSSSQISHARHLVPSVLVLISKSCPIRVCNSLLYSNSNSAPCPRVHFSILAHQDDNDDERRLNLLEILSGYRFFCPPLPTWHLAIWIMGFAGDMDWRGCWYALLGLPSYMITPMTHYSLRMQVRSLVRRSFNNLTFINDLNWLGSRSPCANKLRWHS